MSDPPRSPQAWFLAGLEAAQDAFRTAAVGGGCDASIASAAHAAADRLAARERAAKGFAALAAEQRPCVLLGPERRCTAYDARPIACRGWCSTSRASCERAFAGGREPPALDEPAFFACLGVHEGLRRAAASPRTFELTAALDCALAGEDLDRLTPVEA